MTKSRKLNKSKQNYGDHRRRGNERKRCTEISTPQIKKASDNIIMTQKLSFSWFFDDLNRDC